jgi:hypothetical protein
VLEYENDALGNVQNGRNYKGAEQKVYEQSPLVKYSDQFRFIFLSANLISETDVKTHNY